MLARAQVHRLKRAASSCHRSVMTSSWVWRATVAAAALALVASGAALAIALGRSASDSEQAAASGTTSTVSLSDRKLEAEIAKLEAETENALDDPGWFSENAALIAALLTGLAAAGGLVLTLSRQIEESARQRDADRSQRQRELQQRRDERRREDEARERERIQRDTESRRHLEERFSSLLTDLGSDRGAVQAGAAVSLLSFLRSAQGEFREQVRLVALANLKVAHPEPVRKILLGVFEQAIRLAPPGDRERDLSGADLTGADLSGVDFEGADLDDTTLVGAGLENAVLRRAHGTGVRLESAQICGSDTDLHAAELRNASAPNANFNEATLTATHLVDGDFRGARFQRAKLQAAHLEGSDLSGARFQQADLRDTYFFNRRRSKTATLDEEALATIVRAYNWEAAHFEPAVKKRLDELAADAPPDHEKPPTKG